MNSKRLTHLISSFVPGSNTLLATAIGLVTAMSALAQATFEPYAVKTLAGVPGLAGSYDGRGVQERQFYYPFGVAVDLAGNLYVADQGGQIIRKVTPAGVIITLAGSLGSSGSADGTGSAARFNDPSGLAVDTAGNVYVADKGNHTIRKITPAGVVSTMAGSAGLSGSADGTGSAARFWACSGVTVDNVGNVYVADTGNYTIRKISPSGVVTTLAGLAGYFWERRRQRERSAIPQSLRRDSG